MAKCWYILQTFAGHEQKVEREIRQRLEDGELDSNVITDLKVPMEEIEESHNGKKKIKKSLLLPGYVMLQMDLPREGWKSICNAIRHVPSVSGFVGTGSQECPRPISSDEAKNIFQTTGEIKGERTVRVKQSYEVGDHVKIIDGPFGTFSGEIEKIDTEKNKLHVNVKIFGRLTPVELDFSQVEKE